MTDLAQQIDDKLAKRIAATLRLLRPTSRARWLRHYKRSGAFCKAPAQNVIHGVADRIEHIDGKLNEAEMKAVFDAGVAKRTSSKRSGKRALMVGRFRRRHDMALWYRKQNNHLNEWERGFVNDVTARSLPCSLTARQEEKLKSIFLRLGGEMSL